ESAGSPTWLSFVLYGNPGQVLLRSATVVPLPVPPERSAPAPAEPVPAVEPAVPAPARAPRTARRLGSLLAVIAFLLVAAGLGTWMYREREVEPPPLLVVGVMEVQARTPGVPSWMRQLTRDGLNTILGKFPPIKVYSRQKIDFLQEKDHLTEIEAAEKLKMSKMLSAGVAVNEKNVTLDLDIVDIGTGLLEATERVVGPIDKLMELENELALRALRALGVDPTKEQEQAIFASRGNETLDAYRLFVDTFGSEGGAGEKPAPRPAPAPPPEHQIPRAPAAGSGTSWLSWQAVAWAEEGDGDEAAIRALLNRYEAALTSHSVDQIASLQPELTAADREKLAHYFYVAPDLKVEISNVEVTRSGDDALATFDRKDEFTDSKSGRKFALEHSLDARVRKTPSGDWRIVGFGNDK
ncbi:MAG TPA: hypothetical protein VJ829_09695, partial [Candidatus Binatia bacterium]|nr:hypothetical protein [Candidatus Binatia bacterium]